MVNYLDGYPLELLSGYSNKVAFFSTVYLISNIELNKQYESIKKNMQKLGMHFYDVYITCINTLIKASLHVQLKIILMEF
jgi:hypothetical protein